MFPNSLSEFEQVLMAWSNEKVREWSQMRDVKPVPVKIDYSIYAPNKWIAYYIPPQALYGWEGGGDYIAWIHESLFDYYYQAKAIIEEDPTEETYITSILWDNLEHTLAHEFSHKWDRGFFEGLPWNPQELRYEWEKFKNKHPLYREMSRRRELVASLGAYAITHKSVPEARFERAIIRRRGDPAWQRLLEKK